MKIFSRTLVASISLTMAATASGDFVSDTKSENSQATIRDVLPIESQYYRNAIEPKNAVKAPNDFAFNFGTTPEEATVAIVDVVEEADEFAITESQRASFPFTLAIVSTSVAAILVTGFAAAMHASASAKVPNSKRTNPSAFETPTPKGARGTSGKKSRQVVHSTKN
jgi:hypothetical protein